MLQKHELYYLLVHGFLLNGFAKTALQKSFYCERVLFEKFWNINLHSKTKKL